MMMMEISKISREISSKASKNSKILIVTFQAKEIVDSPSSP
jgi:hypothetical protein